MKAPFILPTLLAVALQTTALPAQVSAEPATATTTYRIRQTAKLSEIPAGAKVVIWWIAILDDERRQDVLDLAVTCAPGTWSIVTEPDRGNRFLLVEVAK